MSSECEPCSISHLAVREGILVNKNLFVNNPPGKEKHRYTEKQTNLHTPTCRHTVKSVILFCAHISLQLPEKLLTPILKLSSVTCYSWFLAHCQLRSHTWLSTGWVWIMIIVTWAMWSSYGQACHGLASGVFSLLPGSLSVCKLVCSGYYKPNPHYLLLLKYSKYSVLKNKKSRVTWLPM